MEDRQRRNRRRFTAEFKRDAVELVRTGGRPIAEIARELGTYDSTLGNWVRQDRIDRGEQDGLTSDEQTRLRELERENARLRMERAAESKIPWTSGITPCGSGCRPSGQAASAGSRVTLWPSCSSWRTSRLA
jgi:transposase-like protein